MKRVREILRLPFCFRHAELNSRRVSSISNNLTGNLTTTNGDPSMAPAPTPRAYRPLAKPSKIRYFKGKAPDAAISSDEDDSDVDVAPPEPVKLDKTLVAGGAGRIVKEPAMKVALRDVKVEGGKVLVGGKLGVVKQGEPNTR